MPPSPFYIRRRYVVSNKARVKNFTYLGKQYTLEATDNVKLIDVNKKALLIFKANGEVVKVATNETIGVIKSDGSYWLFEAPVLKQIKDGDPKLISFFNEDLTSFRINISKMILRWIANNIDINKVSGVKHV